MKLNLQEHQISALTHVYCRYILAEKLADVLLGVKLPIDICRSYRGPTLQMGVVIAANKKIARSDIKRMITYADVIDIDPGPIFNKISAIFHKVTREFAQEHSVKLAKLQNLIEQFLKEEYPQESHDFDNKAIGKSLITIESVALRMADEANKAFELAVFKMYSKSGE